MYRIRKSFTFEAAHQLETAFTQGCYECIHGHTYTVEMIIVSDKLTEPNRMVLDFGELKPFKDKLMEAWDHGLLLHKNKEPFYEPIIAAGHLKRSKVTFLDENPTAEVMARIIYYQLHKFLEAGAFDNFMMGRKVQKIRVHETGTGWAEYSEGKA